MSKNKWSMKNREIMDINNLFYNTPHKELNLFHRYWDFFMEIVANKNHTDSEFSQ